MLLNKWMRQILVLILFLFLIVALDNNRNNLHTNAPLKSEPALTVLIPEHCKTLDPAKAGDRQSAMIINHIYEGLVKYKPGTAEVQPALATSWEVQQNGKVWIFSLRRRVKFHDHTPFNAQAVKFSVERVMADNKHPYGDMAFGMIKKVEVLDDYSIKFILKYPYASFIHNLSMPWAAPVVSPTAVKNFGADYDRYPVGTGPFKLEKWHNEQLVLVANEDYWQQPPPTKKVIFRVEPEAENRYQMLLQQKADIVTDMTIPQVDKAKRDNLSVLQGENLSINYLGFYNNKPPFNSSRIRRAVVMAVDRQQLVSDGYNGMLPVAENYLPPGLLGYDQKLTQYPFNPEAAVNLLKQNGYPHGMSLTMITYQGTRPYNPVGGEELAMAIKAQLAQRGIIVTVQAYPWLEYKEALKKQEGHCFLYGWAGDHGDADNFLYTLLSSWQIERGLNLSQYKNPQVDRLLASAQQVTDYKKRERLYYHAQQIILQEAPWLILSYGSDFVITSPWVHDLTLQPPAGCYLYRVYKEK